MTESKDNLASGFNELYYIIEEEESIQEPKEEIIEIVKINDDNYNSLVDKKRASKRWKNSFGHYSLNPEKFTFSLKDL